MWSGRSFPTHLDFFPLRQKNACWGLVVLRTRIPCQVHIRLAGRRFSVLLHFTHRFPFRGVFRWIFLSRPSRPVPVHLFAYRSSAFRLFYVLFSAVLVIVWPIPCLVVDRKWGAVIFGKRLLFLRLQLWLVGKGVLGVDSRFDWVVWHFRGYRGNLFLLALAHAPHVTYIDQDTVFFLRAPRRSDAASGHQAASHPNRAELLIRHY